MKKIVLVLVWILYSGCAVKLDSISIKNHKKIDNLESMIENLSKDVDPKEARDLARGVLEYTKTLASKYHLMRPPYFHNFLVNINLKDRGLCYHWMHDLRAFVESKRYKTLLFYDAISNPDMLTEHSALVVGAKGVPFRESIILDPWRNSGVLFAKKVKDDKMYQWMEIEYKKQ